VARRRPTPMTKTIPAATARTQFGQLLELAQTKGTRFIISKNGEPAVVILAIADYLENIDGEPKALAKLQAAAKKRGLDLLSLDDIDREVAATRAAKRTKPRRS